MDKPTQEEIDNALKSADVFMADVEAYLEYHPSTDEFIVLADALREAQAEVSREQSAHESIATLCFSAGVSTNDGTSMSAVKNLVAEVARLREIVEDEKKNNFTQGVAWAIGFLSGAHGEDSIARDMANNAGIHSKDELRAAHVDQWDLDQIGDAIPEHDASKLREGK